MIFFFDSTKCVRICPNSSNYDQFPILRINSINFLPFLQINIPELSSKGPLWKYFSKINIDALVEIARRRKGAPTLDRDESNTFADIRKRFGQHRKSIKNRVKKLYNRDGGCEEREKIPIACNNGKAASPPRTMATTAQSKPSGNAPNRFGLHLDAAGYFNRRDNYLFGSMLKKSRTSLTFDDSARKKFTVLPVKAKLMRSVEVGWS